jgi:predicted AlkP superfamily pyrophosphatase or phosphodiesterase
MSQNEIRSSSRASRTRPILAALLAPLALLPACSSVPRVDVVYGSSSTFSAETQRVLIVSFDGLRADAIDQADMPHLSSMRQAGLHTQSAQSVMPSITLVNHASMVSGVGPDKHRIDWNDYQPQRGPIGVSTVFELAKSKGLTTAMVAGKPKFAHLNRPGSIDHFEIQEGSAMEVAQAASAVIRSSLPQLMMIHFRHGDAEGHSHGWMSSEQLGAFADDDQALGHVLNTFKELGVLETTTVIVSADHGGHERTHGTSDPVDTTIPWVATGAEIPRRGHLDAQVTTYDTAATAADLLELEIPAGWDGRSVLSRI